MSQVKYAQKTFNMIWEEVKKTIEFNPLWKNGTGYLDNIVYDKSLGLKYGEAAKFVDDFNRRCIVVGLGDFGNVVMFERYTPDNNGLRRSEVFVCNKPDLKLNFLDSRLYEKEITFIYSGWRSQLAVMLSAIRNHNNEPEDEDDI